MTQTFPAGGLRPSSGFAGDFNGDGFTDLVVGNNGDGGFSLFLGGAGGLSLSQSIASAAVPAPTALSFAGVSDGVLSFYASTAGPRGGLAAGLRPQPARRAPGACRARSRRRTASRARPSPVPARRAPLRGPGPRHAAIAGRGRRLGDGRGRSSRWSQLLGLARHGAGPDRPAVHRLGRPGRVRTAGESGGGVALLASFLHRGRPGPGPGTGPDDAARGARRPRGRDRRVGRPPRPTRTGPACRPGSGSPWGSQGLGASPGRAVAAGGDRDPKAVGRPTSGLPDGPAIRFPHRSRSGPSRREPGRPDAPAGTRLAHSGRSGPPTAIAEVAASEGPNTRCRRRCGDRGTCRPRRGSRQGVRRAPAPAGRKSWPRRPGRSQQPDRDRPVAVATPAPCLGGPAPAIGASHARRRRRPLVVEPTVTRRPLTSADRSDVIEFRGA